MLRALLILAMLAPPAGRPRVVAFWATWCGACRTELRWLEQLHREGKADVETYAMDERGWPVVTPYLKQHGLTLPVKLVTRDALRRAGLTEWPETLPRTLVFDARGRLAKDSHVAVE
jgi:thiol-disulfide isomerase/thioredoxin